MYLETTASCKVHQGRPILLFKKLNCVSSYIGGVVLEERVHYTPIQLSRQSAGLLTLWSWVRSPQQAPSQLVYMVRIPRFHRGERGSIPLLGTLFLYVNVVFFYLFKLTSFINLNRIAYKYLRIEACLVLHEKSNQSQKQFVSQSRCFQIWKIQKIINNCSCFVAQH